VHSYLNEENRSDCLHPGFGLSFEEEGAKPKEEEMLNNMINKKE